MWFNFDWSNIVLTKEKLKKKKNESSITIKLLLINVDKVLLVRFSNQPRFSVISHRWSPTFHTKRTTWEKLTDLQLHEKNSYHNRKVSNLPYKEDYIRKFCITMGGRISVSPIRQCLPYLSNIFQWLSVRNCVDWERRH